MKVTSKTTEQNTVEDILTKVSDSSLPTVDLDEDSSDAGGRKLASVRIVRAIYPIPGADRIECVLVDGWELITQKGSFSVGDKCVYIEIDSVVPDAEPFEFMRSRGFHVKTIKLRGQISQGLALPISSFPFITDGVAEGTDLTDMLGITKYSKAKCKQTHEPSSIKSGSKLIPWVDKFVPGVLVGFIRRNIPWLFKRMLKVRPMPKEFPTFITKTDAERIQNVIHKLERYAMPGSLYTVTEKLEGTSLTVFVKGGKVHVCSRNLYQSELGNGIYWNAVKSTGLYDALLECIDKYEGLALQAELIGPNIQNNIYKLTEHHIKVHRVLDIETDDYLSLSDVDEFISDLDCARVSRVPIICYVRTDDPAYYEMKPWLDLANRMSAINPAVRAEGIVIVRDQALGYPRLNGAQSLKCINPEYLLSIESK